MGPIVVVLLLALVLAAAVIVYVAYPYRGEQTPSPRLGRRHAARRASRCRRSTSSRGRAPRSTAGRRWWTRTADGPRARV